MKRRILVRLAYCIALGVITTLGVALACARRVCPSEVFLSNDGGTGVSPSGWGIVVHRAVGCVLITSLVVPPDSIKIIKGAEYYPPAEELAPSWLWLRPDRVQFEQDSPRFAYAVGWPLEALGCELMLDEQHGMTVGRDAVEFTSSTEESSGRLLDVLLGDDRRRRFMPLRPLGWRFAADSVIYATAWALPLLALRAHVRWVRGAIRRRQGRCAQCGYTLRGLSGLRCPECGFE